MKDDIANDLSLNKVQMSIKDAYQQQLLLSANEQDVIENTVQRILDSVQAEQKIELRDTILQGIKNVESSISSIDENTDMSHEQRSMSLQSQLTLNTIYCILASELTLLVIDRLVDEPSKIDVYTQNFIKMTDDLENDISQNQCIELANMFGKDIESDLEKLNKIYESEISSMSIHLLNQYKYSLFHSMKKIPIKLYEFPFLAESVSEQSDCLKWLLFSKEYLVTHNPDCTVFKDSSVACLDAEFQMARTRDERGLIISLAKRNKLDIFDYLSDLNIKSCSESLSDIVIDFNHSTQQLIQSADKLMKMKGQYLMRALAVLEINTRANLNI